LDLFARDESGGASWSQAARRFASGMRDRGDGPVAIGSVAWAQDSRGKDRFHRTDSEEADTGEFPQEPTGAANWVKSRVPRSSGPAVLFRRMLMKVLTVALVVLTFTSREPVRWPGGILLAPAQPNLSDPPAPGSVEPVRARSPSVNIGEIARRAGVSRRTVSYALSGKRPVSEDTRWKRHGSQERPLLVTGRQTLTSG